MPRACWRPEAGPGSPKRFPIRGFRIADIGFRIMSRGFRITVSESQFPNHGLRIMASESWFPKHGFRIKAVSEASPSFRIHFLFGGAWGASANDVLMMCL